MEWAEKNGNVPENVLFVAGAGQVGRFLNRREPVRFLCCLRLNGASTVMAAQFYRSPNEISLGNIRKQAKALASRGLGEFPHFAGWLEPAENFEARVVAVVLRVASHRTVGGRLSALLNSFFFSARGLFLRNPIRSGALGDTVFDSHFQRLAGLPAVVVSASAEANHGHAGRLAGDATADTGIGWP